MFIDPSSKGNLGADGLQTSVADESSVKTPGRLKGWSVSRAEGVSIIAKSEDQVAGKPIAARRVRRHHSEPNAVKLAESKKPGRFNHSGIHATASYPDQGIPAQHLAQLQLCVAPHNAVISIRPFSKLATKLMLAGRFSKSLNYKLKSSNWGPHCGLLPVNQKYSKKAQADSTTLSNLQAYADEHKKEAVHCRIEKERLLELANTSFEGGRQQAVLEDLVFHDDGAASFHARPCDGQDVYQFQATPDESGQYLISVKEGSDYQPLMIIDRIADYDLGFVCFHYDDIELGRDDKERDHSGKSEEELTAYLQQKYLQRSQSQADLTNRAQSFNAPSMGLITDREAQLISELNSAVGRSDENPMFHHGADNRNPGSKLEDNFPLTVILPKSVGELDDYHYMIETPEELAEMVHILKNEGYHVPMTSLWGDVSAVRSDGFNQYAKLVGDAKDSVSLNSKKGDAS